MSKLRKQIIPQLFHILIFLLVCAVTADDFTFQPPSLNTKPVLQQILNNDDPGDGERHIWKVSKNLPRSEYDSPYSFLVIRNYLKHFSECLIPASPSIFFQPDRAPPV